MQPLSSPTDQPAPAAMPPLPAAPPMRRHVSASLLALMVALLIILGAALISSIPGLVAGPGSNKAGKTTPQAALAGFHLYGISMIAPDEGWAVGDRPRSAPDTNPITGVVDQNAVEPIILHYKAGRLTLDQLPPDLNPYNLDMSLGNISMVSATEGWASGSTLLPAYPPITHNGVTSVTVVDGITFPVLLHYTGGKWVLIQNPPVALGSIVMRSASDGWAIGEVLSPQPSRPLALHYNGSTWSGIQDPAFASLTPDALAAAPDGEVWITAVDGSEPGFDGDDPAAILHYDGHRWAREQISLANDRLLGLAMVSASEGWAVGYDPGGTRVHHTGPQQGLIVHYHNGVWQPQSAFASPSDNAFFYLSAIAMVSASEGWAVGQEGVIVHYLNGAWTKVQSPTHQALQSITMTSPAEGWAVGDNGTILHYLHGVWSLYRS